MKNSSAATKRSKTASSLPKLLYVIVSHRFSHLINGEGFRD